MFLMSCVAANAYDFVVDNICYNIIDKTNKTVEVTYYGETYYSSESLNFYTGEITIPTTVSSNNVTYRVVRIGKRAFYSSFNMKGVILPNSVTSIDTEAFYGVGIRSINFNNVETIGELAFKLSSLTKIVLPDKVVEIGANAFELTKSATSLTLSKNLKVIPEGAFLNSGLTGELIIPETVEQIAKAAFALCNSLKRVVFSSKDTKLAYNAFVRCPNLEEIVLPDMADFNMDGLGGCSSLKQLCLPRTVKKFTPNGEYFTKADYSDNYFLKSLTRIDVYWTSEDELPEISSNYLYFPQHIIGNATLYVPQGTKDIYKSHFPWRDLKIVERPLTANLTKQDGTNDEVGLSDGCSLTLNDNLKSVAIGDENINNVDITYNRSFTVDCWQGWYVPFDMTVTSELLDDFTFGEIYDIQITNEEAVENATIEFVRMKAGDVLKANTPYLIRPKTTGDKVFSANGTTLHTTPKTGEVASIDCSTTKDIYTFTGVYEPTFMKEKNGYYLATDGGFNYTTSATTKIGAFRYYMTIKNRQSGEFYYPGSEANAPERINLMEVDEATLINDIRRNAETEAVMFNLQGMKVGNEYKGVVIINGKKHLNK